MPRPRRRRCRPLSRKHLLVVPVAVLALGATGCSGGGSHEPAAAPTSPSAPAPTPLAQVRTTQMTVGRAGFCAQVAPDAVEGALGSEPSRSERWRNGQRATLTAGVTDVAHEFGCQWTAGTGASAAAWVFAPPITAAEGARLRAAAIGATGCHAVPGVPRFGRPTVAVRCTDHGGTTVALHGLFGDAWLSCSLTEPPRPGGSPAPTATASSGSAAPTATVGTTGASPSATAGSLVDRTEQWCVSVAQAAAA
jgi:hypothetical protein